MRPASCRWLSPLQQQLAATVIPLPRLDVQSEIGGVLSAFHQQIDGLQTEAHTLNECLGTLLEDLTAGHLTLGTLG